MKLKMSGPDGVITICRNPDRALRSENKPLSLTLESLAETLTTKELTKLWAMIDKDDIIIEKKI